MKRFLAMFMSVVLMIGIMPTAALAADIVDSGKCGDNLTWKFTDDGVLTISGEGSMGDFENYLEAPWRRYRKNTNHIVVEDGVTDIGNYAFYETSAVNVSIPNSVMKIGDYAFMYGYFNEITIPDSVTTIGDYAFYFSDIKEVILPDSVVSIGQWAFASCLDLTEVSIPGSVKRIGSNAFDHCRELTDVTIEKGVVEIGDAAFSCCAVLTGVEIPDSVETIGESAFRECYALTEITIPKSVTSIGNNAFIYCESLEEIVVDKGNQHYSSDENGVLFNKNMTELIQAPIKGMYGKYTIPDGVKCIKENAFLNCINMTKVEIPDSVVTIEELAFGSCDGLENVNIPASVKEISDLAFTWCSKLNEFIVDEDSATYSNDELGVLFSKDKTTLIMVPGAKTEYIVPDGVITINDHAFYSMYQAKITVPASVTNIGGYIIWSDTIQEIRFMGDVPSFHWINFKPTEPVNVYYPRNNRTWIEFIGRIEYENVTWIPYTPSERLLGDVDGNGEISNTDLVMVARYIVELYDENTVADIEAYGDMNGDGEVTNTDLITMARIIVGLV